MSDGQKFSRLLINESPMQFLPSLACKVGTERAILLQQIHYLLQMPQSGCEIEGHHYIWNTAKDFHRFYFKWITPKTINYHLKILEDNGLLIVLQPGKEKGDMKKFFRIDYAALDACLLSEAAGDDDAPTNSNILEMPNSNGLEMPNSNILEMPFPTNENSLKEQEKSSLQETSSKEQKIANKEQEIIIISDQGIDVAEKYRFADHNNFRPALWTLYREMLAWVEKKKAVKKLSRPQDWASALNAVFDNGYSLQEFFQCFEWLDVQTWTKNVSPVLIRDKFEDFLEWRSKNAPALNPVTDNLTETPAEATAEDLDESFDYIHTVLKAAFVEKQKVSWLPGNPAAAGALFRDVSPNLPEERFRNETEPYFSADEFREFTDAYFDAGRDNVPTESLVSDAP